MRLVDTGSGTPIVVIPGIQGRWEWMRPAVDGLARHCRVITFSLADEPSAQTGVGPRLTFDTYVEQVRDAMAQAGIDSAAICGISYGGLIAAAFAGRYPERTSALVLVSAIPPTWAPDARIRFYLKAPRLLVPLFMLSSLRLFGEILRAAPGVRAALGAGCRHAWNVLTHMFSPFRMARRATLLEGRPLGRDVAAVTAPVLVVVGEQGLDRVVPVASTMEYLRLLPQARAVTLERTGHLGSITRPEAFAEIVVPFVQGAAARL